MKKVIHSLLISLVISGCSEDLSSHLQDVSIEIYAESFDDVSRFSRVYEMWKNNVDSIHIQAGTDNYTGTYLLHTMPHIYSTVIKSMNQYEMKAYALLNSNSWMEESHANSREIERILNYNKNYTKERFKGVSMKLDLNNMKKESFEVYLNNLREAKNKIDIHNITHQDNLSLSVNINSKIAGDDLFVDLLTIVDRVIHDDFDIDFNELMSSTIYENISVAILMNQDRDFHDSYSIKQLKENLNSHKSFNGIVVVNYSHYLELQKNKAP